MNIYLDTEFINQPHYHKLISVALVREDGREYYAVSSDFDPTKASPWVRENVLNQLEESESWKKPALIREEIKHFIGYQIPRIWAFQASYDWCMMVELYGGYMALPANFPRYFHELLQEIDRWKWSDEYWPKRENSHHALADARWNRRLHQELMRFAKNKSSN